MSSPKQPIDQHNYYRSGIDRVIVLLRHMNVPLADTVLRRIATMSEDVVAQSGLAESPAFSPLDHAIMDRFEGRDYLLAQQLLHPSKVGSNGWHTIAFPENPNEQGGVDYVLSPSLLDATAVAIDQCDRTGSRIDAVESSGSTLALRSGQRVAATISPIQFEPFSLANRDRVRAAFKHIRVHSNPELLHSRLKKIPGFERVGFHLPKYLNRPANEGCLLFGYPSNWAGAMRSALADVDISVKLHQAQELVACFFGAASWHQLVAHQDDEMPVLVPTCVAWGKTDHRQHRYYRTTEEAIYAAGQVIGAERVDVVVDYLSLTMSNYPATFSCAERSVFDAMPEEMPDFLRHHIESGWNDVQDASSCPDGVVAAAERLLRAVSSKERNPADALSAARDEIGQFFAAQERAGIIRKNIVQASDHFLSFKLADVPGERDFLSVHKLAGNRVIAIHDGIPLYKASLLYEPDSQSLIIKADYQNETVATIPLHEAGCLDSVREITQRSIGYPVLELDPCDVRFN